RARESALDLAGDVAEMHAPPRSRRALDRERVTVEVMIALERLDQQGVERGRDRAPPVGIAAEHAGRRLAGHVVDAVALAARIEDVRLVAMHPRHRADTVRRPEIALR